MPRSLEALFSNSRFSEYQRSQHDKMRQEISELSSGELENSTDSLALIFSSKYSPSVIELHEPIQEDIGQIEKTIERLGPSLNLPRGGKVIKKCHRMKLKVPYDGEKQLLLRRPRSVTHPLPSYDELSEEEIVHYVDYEVKGKDAESIKDTIDNDISEWRKRLERSVKNLNRDIRKMQASLEDKARRYIEDHRENMRAKEEALAELGISTQTSNEGFVEPEKKKEIEPPDLEGSSQEKKRIRDQTFIDLLDIIESMRVDLERSKNRVRELDEESLRDIFLAAINTHYGSATAESFNRSGKTDILFRHQGENLFVAECKVWAGKKKFTDAIDQLLDNLTADDRHSALVVFSNREDVLTVRSRVGDAIESHETFLGALSSFQDHEVFRLKNRSGSEVMMAVKVVDLAA